ncbi:uncharacterized protein MELLADRAFT_108961 [Melampsora larici-populina 98AG31]|uniref:Peptidase S54 rhomboid domain-containing protein n=1 Tax=Melampsora larici-populina (strain 98AG31 / pathotype 3-4-7) TaxID=747676 RepID=F4RUV9_MELLP|nr:uncharacterized protein MELLADRAFT_108961 [Melampsora larici-populina 98AG31]EGG03762.1 hypothetical protein MELLADRAFT_108961 [Melampsora larici-populina 98AG31]
MGHPSTFANAPITKVAVLGCSLISFLLSNHQDLLDLPLKPELTQNLQFWRILSHHFVCSDLIDVLLIVILLWNVSIPIERIFGSIKYASFLLVTIIMGSFLELLVLVIGNRLFDYQAIPSGPFLIAFSILYQHQKLIPSLHDYDLNPFKFDSHTFLPNLLSLFIFCLNPISSTLGLLVGSIYNLNQFKFNQWRIPSSILPRFLLHSQTSMFLKFEDPNRRPRTSGVLVPSPPTEVELNELLVMFPDLSRDEVLKKWNLSGGSLTRTVDLILNPSSTAASM